MAASLIDNSAVRLKSMKRKYRLLEEENADLTEELMTARRTIERLRNERRFILSRLIQLERLHIPQSETETDTSESEDESDWDLHHNLATAHPALLSVTHALHPATAMANKHPILTNGHRVIDHDASLAKGDLAKPGIHAPIPILPRPKTGDRRRKRGERRVRRRASRESGEHMSEESLERRESGEYMSDESRENREIREEESETNINVTDLGSLSPTSLSALSANSTNNNTASATAHTNHTHNNPNHNTTGAINQGDNVGICVAVVRGRSCRSKSLTGFKYCWHHAPMDPTSPYTWCQYLASGPGKKKKCNIPVLKAKVIPYCKGHLKESGIDATSAGAAAPIPGVDGSPLPPKPISIAPKTAPISPIAPSTPKLASDNPTASGNLLNKKRKEIDGPTHRGTQKKKKEVKDTTKDKQPQQPKEKRRRKEKRSTASTPTTSSPTTSQSTPPKTNVTPIKTVAKPIALAAPPMSVVARVGNTHTSPLSALDVLRTHGIRSLLNAGEEEEERQLVINEDSTDTSEDEGGMTIEDEDEELSV